MKQLAYIAFLFLLVTAQATAQVETVPYEIEKVCRGTQRSYWVNGERGSTWLWTLKDADGNELELENPEGFNFDALENGEPIQRSEITINWDNLPGTYYLSVAQTSLEGCPADELGYVTVLEPPEVEVETAVFACPGEPVALSGKVDVPATASWVVMEGTGTVVNPANFETEYIPSPEDIEAGSVTLMFIATVDGLLTGACDITPVPVTITLSDLDASLTAEMEICEGEKLQLNGNPAGGIEPYTHKWTGNARHLAFLSATNVADPVFNAAGNAPRGEYTFTYTVTDSAGCEVTEEITIKIKDNTPPLAENDEAFTLPGEPVDVDVLVNDHDSNSELNRSSVTIVDAPANGTVLVNSQTGVVTYTPEPGFTGTETFTYSVCDDGIPCGALCDTALVTVNVSSANQPPVAVNDSFTVVCYPLIEYLLPNDYDPDGDNIRMVLWSMVDVQHGTLTIEQDGAFIYMPDQGFTGIDTFVYRIYDDGNPQLWDEATVWINVLPEEDCDNLPDDDDEILTDCALMIPDGFSPNGDGVHDFFQIFCIEKYPQATLRIFDRAGNKLFQKHNYGNLDYWGSDENAWWWGVSEHKLTLGRGTLPSGTFLYVLELGNGEVRTGSVMIAY